jgi:CheY-like chemotaxis protein
VVVVDDEPVIRDLLTRMIQRSFPGQPVYACQTTAQALAAVATTPVACVLTDYDLGADDGVTLAQTLHRSWPDLPIILLTGLTPTADALGVAAFVAVLVKPIQMDMLRAALRPYLQAVAYE